ncbi:hypothetical protein N7490_005041 [Penicillium lividum]|nr:hypothetical protein N7490_005041 [Penicillium lividum]
MKTFCQRATAIDILWNFKGATPEMRPGLIITGPGSYHCLRLISATVVDNIAQDRERVPLLVSSIYESQTVIKTRKDMLKSSER